MTEKTCAVHEKHTSSEHVNKRVVNTHVMFRIFLFMCVNILIRVCEYSYSCKSNREEIIGTLHGTIGMVLQCVEQNNFTIYFLCKTQFICLRKVS